MSTVSAFISITNSTEVALGAAGTFTPAFEEVKDFSHLVVLTHSDQASAAGGLLFEWSNDGTTVHRSEPARTVAAGVGDVFQSDVIGRWFRVNYTNGATLQGTFSLQTILRYVPSARVEQATAVETEDVTASGSITAQGQSIEISPNSHSTATFQLTGTWSASLRVEARTSAGTWVIVPVLKLGSSSYVLAISVNDEYIVSVGAYTAVRLTAFTFSSGTVTVDARVSIGIQANVIQQILQREGSIVRADGVGNAQATVVGHSGNTILHNIAGFAFNGTTWDRQRNNLGLTALSSASRTTTQTVAVTNYNHVAGRFYLNVTSAGTGSITLSIEEIDPVSGATRVILAGVAVTANGLNVYEVGPGLVAVANQAANAFLPRSFNIVVTANNVNAVSYSVGYALMGW